MLGTMSPGWGDNEWGSCRQSPSLPLSLPSSHPAVPIPAGDTDKKAGKWQGMPLSQQLHFHIWAQTELPTHEQMQLQIRAARQIQIM